MRILNVEFGNLNSLAGSWKVDFEHPEFQSDGIFLITGPTGSGKTTLLDAICLALYGKTPRTNPGNSQNELMTRQTGECWAEVLFASPKGRMRAKWAQKRANGKPGGKLQAPKWELAQEDGKLICTKLSEMPQAIKEYTGLDFNQFIRAVMLAQNRFDSFLSSKDDEKSEILEKLTDTSIYSDLSRLAFQKCKETRENVDKLEERLSALQPLSEDQIAEKKSAAEKIAQNCIQADAALEARRTALAWLKKIDELLVKAGEIERDFAILADEENIFAKDRQLLADSRAAEEFEGDYAVLSARRKEAKDIKTELVDVAEQLISGKSAYEAASAFMEKNGEQHQRAMETLERQKPVFMQARNLDAQINTYKNLISEQQKSLIELSRKLHAGESEKNSISSELSALAAQQISLQNWVEDNPGCDWLHQNLSALKFSHKEIGSLWKEIGDAELRTENAKKLLAQIQADYSRKKEEDAAIAKKIADLSRIYEDEGVKLATLLAGRTIDEIREIRQERFLLLDRAKTLIERRKELVRGKECPLCGSCEHPWAELQEPDLKPLEIACRDMDTLLQDINKIEAERAGIDREREENQKIRAQLELDIKIMEEKIRHLQEQFESLEKDVLSRRELVLQKESKLRENVTRYLPDIEWQSKNLPRLLEERLKNWQETQAQLQKIEQRKQAIEKEIIRLDAEKNNLFQLVQQKQHEFEQAQNLLSSLSHDRKTLLPAQDVDAEENRLAAEVKQLRDSLELKREEVARLDQTQRVLSARQDLLKKKEAKILPELQTLEDEFIQKLARQGMDESKFLQIRMPREKMAALGKREAELLERRHKLTARKEENVRSLMEEKARNLTASAAPDIMREISDLAEEKERLLTMQAQISHELSENDKLVIQSGELRNTLAVHKAEASKWAALNNLIGSADGKKFRAFAQSVTLDRLLEFANMQLAKINPRYTLKRAQGQITDKNSNLDLSVVDHYQAGETRSIRNLSGGETFMASLALALGLSAMAGKNATLGSLFLDEGFGTLDSDALEAAFSAIGSLRQEGKLVGIISHVEAMKEWIPTQIQLTPNNGAQGRSAMSGPGCGPAPKRK